MNRKEHKNEDINDSFFNNLDLNKALFANLNMKDLSKIMMTMIN